MSTSMAECPLSSCCLCLPRRGQHVEAAAGSVLMPLSGIRLRSWTTECPLHFFQPRISLKLRLIETPALLTLQQVLFFWTFTLVYSSVVFLQLHESDLAV